MKFKPWWFCTGWWSPWCVIDVVLKEHTPRWVHKKHDEALIKHTTRREVT